MVSNVSFQAPKPITVTAVKGKNAKQHQQQMYKAPDGRITTKNQAMLSFEGKVKEQNDAVIAHENAHFTASGPQAISGPHYNIANIHGKQVITGGHVGVSVPGAISFKASKPQIEKTMKAAEYVKKGAEAPLALSGKAGELSNADKHTAQQAEAVLSSARVAFVQRQDIESRMVKQEGKAPDGVLTEAVVQKTKGEHKKEDKQKVASNPITLGNTDKRRAGNPHAIGKSLNFMS